MTLKMMTCEAISVNPSDLCEILVIKLSEEVRREGMDRAWVKAVIDILRSLGEARGFAVATEHEHEEHGFLLDLLWWKDFDLTEIVLAAEAVWGSNSQIWHDFGKLLFVEAPIKLMIYGTGHHQAESQSVRKGIQEEMQRFAHHVAGEKYVLLELAIPEKMAYTYCYAVPKDGQLSDIQFDLLSNSSLEW